MLAVFTTTLNIYFPVNPVVNPNTRELKNLDRALEDSKKMLSRTSLADNDGHCVVHCLIIPKPPL